MLSGLCPCLLLGHALVVSVRSLGLNVAAAQAAALPVLGPAQTLLGRTSAVLVDMPVSGIMNGKGQAAATHLTWQAELFQEPKQLRIVLGC
jgi:hypothetical protein